MEKGKKEEEEKIKREREGKGKKIMLIGKEKEGKERMTRRKNRAHY